MILDFEKQYQCWHYLLTTFRTCSAQYSGILRKTKASSPVSYAVHVVPCSLRLKQLRALHIVSTVMDGVGICKKHRTGASGIFIVRGIRMHGSRA